MLAPCDTDWSTLRLHPKQLLWSCAWCCPGRAHTIAHPLLPGSVSICSHLPWYLPTEQSLRGSSSWAFSGIKTLVPCPRGGHGCLAWSMAVRFAPVWPDSGRLECARHSVLSVFTLILLMNNGICSSFLTSSSPGTCSPNHQDGDLDLINANQSANTKWTKVISIKWGNLPFCDTDPLKYLFPFHTWIWSSNLSPVESFLIEVSPYSDCFFLVEEEQPLELFIPGTLARVGDGHSPGICLGAGCCSCSVDLVRNIPDWLMNNLPLAQALPGWLYSQLGEITASSQAAWLTLAAYPLWTSVGEPAGEMEPSHLFTHRTGPGCLVFPCWRRVWPSYGVDV